MLNINDLAQAKKTARALEKALERNGITLQHGKALDVLASLCGRGDWNTLSQALSPQGVDAQLSEFEREHAASCEGLDYGKEAMLVAHTGFQLRYSAETDLCEYVRVCDPLGREIVYWDSAEWEEDPQVVMGALLGALVRGNPMPVELARKKAAKAAAPAAAPAAVRLPTIRDVPFCDIVSAVVDGSGGYRAMWHDQDLVEMLRDPNDPNFEDNADEIALYLEKDDDGLVFTEELTLAKLVALQWDPARQLFVDPEGVTYEFYFPASMAQWLTLPPAGDASPAVTQVVSPPDAAKQEPFIKGHPTQVFAEDDQVPEMPEGYQRFTVKFRLQSEHAMPVTVRVLGRNQAEATAHLEARFGHVDVLDMAAAERKPKLYNAVLGYDNAPAMQVATRIAGYDEADARRRLLAVFKDVPAHLKSVQLTPCAAGEVEEFSVFVDGGFYNTVPTLEQAISLAEVLEPTGSDEVSIEDRAGNCLWTVPCQNQETDDGNH